MTGQSTLHEAYRREPTEPPSPASEWFWQGGRAAIFVALSRPLASALCALLALPLLLAGCGSDDRERAPQLILERAGEEPEPPGEAPPPTFPNTATVNTVRVAGRDAIEDAAGVASAVFPATAETNRPDAVVIVDQGDWQGAVAASVLAGGEIGAPILLARGDQLPAVTAGTLARLDPPGDPLAENAQAIVVGEGTARPDDRRIATIEGADAFELAAEVDRFSAAAEGEPSDAVVIASAEQAGFAMPAAAWAARSSDAVLFTEPDALPQATIDALADHEEPDIFVLGPESVISEDVERQLRRLGGRVERIEGATPVETAIEFARYDAGGFGWGLVTPGHNYTLATTSRPPDVAAAASLATNGTYAPLLLTDAGDELPRALRSYFLDVQPGFEENPNSGVYNRVWILGDQDAVSLGVQAQIDALAELIPVEIDGQPVGGDESQGGAREPGGGTGLPVPEAEDPPGRGAPSP